jgi:hypothetical protein
MDINFNTQGYYQIPIFWDAKVVSLDDPNSTGQIKVFISGIDNPELESNPNLLDSDGRPILPIALPLLPKHLNIYPKIGERVTVMVQKATLGNQSSFGGTRYWIGPCISQPQKLDYEDFKSSQSMTPSGNISLDTSIKTKPSAEGVYPSKEYISIQGRDNTDLIFKKQEVLIRSGKFIPSRPKEFNGKDPGYIQIRYLSKNDDDVTTDSDNEGSSINIVSNYINLLSHKGIKSGKFVLTNNKDMITNKDQSYINSKTHPVPFGDILVNFLKLVQNFATQHIHPYPGMSPDPDDSLKKLKNFDLNSILNKYVRTN